MNIFLIDLRNKFIFSLTGDPAGPYDLVEMEIETPFYSQGVRIASTIALPGSSPALHERFPIVILCHGHSRHRNDGLDVLAQRLASSGIASLRFDFRGCGTTAENRYRLNCFADWPTDLMNAMSFVETLPFADGERIGVAGISMGGSTAVYVSGIDSRVRSAVAMSAPAECGKWLKGVWERSKGCWDDFLLRVRTAQRIAAATGSSSLVPVLEMYNKGEAEIRDLFVEAAACPGVNAYVAMESLGNLLSFNPLEQCRGIQCPIFFAHGAEDELVPVSNSRAMYDAVTAVPKKLEVYPGVDHNIPLSAGREKVFTDIVSWFTTSLSVVEARRKQ